MRIDDISCFAQERVAAAKIMVVGCGALGNEVLKHLALFGVGHLVIVDFDTVEPRNLSRSVFYRLTDAEGHRYKVEVMAERLHELNPDVDIKTICGDVAYDVGLGLIREMDVVIGCVDSRWARYCINRLCMRAGKPWVDGGIGELEGTARVFVPGKNCYACNLGDEGLEELRRRMPCSGTIKRNLDAGKAPTTSIVASIVGAVEVQEALKIINENVNLNDNENVNEKFSSLCGKMFYYEGGHLTTKLVDFQAYDDDCPVHECWEPVTESPLTNTTTVTDTLTWISSHLAISDPRFSIPNDCFVDYVENRSDNKRIEMMTAGRNVAEKMEKEVALSGMPLSGFYQHEYKTIDGSFPSPHLTLAELGIPEREILRVNNEQYILIK